MPVEMSASTGQVLVVDVVGTPAPQGSKSFKGFRGCKPVLVGSCAAAKPWRDAVAQAVANEMNTTGVATVFAPSSVTIDFYLPRPASAPKHRTPDRRPDLDKLVRSTLDALTIAKAIEDVPVSLRSSRSSTSPTIVSSGAVVSLAACEYGHRRRRRPHRLFKT